MNRFKESLREPRKDHPFSLSFLNRSIMQDGIKTFWGTQMKKMRYILGLLAVLIAVNLFAGTEKVISHKNDYGGKTVEIEEDGSVMGVYKEIIYYDQNGKKAKRELYSDGKNIWKAYKIISYYDINETQLFEEHFDQKGNPLEDKLGWRYFGSTAYGDFYYRARDISHLPNNKIRVWCKVRLSKRTISEIAAKYAGKADGLSYLENLYEIDSKTRTWATRLVGLYDKTGRLIDKEMPKEHELAWDLIPKGSPVECLYNILNNRKR